MARWQRYTKKRSAIPEQPAAEATDIKRAGHHARRAWDRVQADGSARNWHRLRIAIKDLRYTLDSVPLAERDARLKKALKLCKRLQEYLGDWHDTVVHLQLLRELVDRGDAPADDDSLQVVAQWRVAVEREGHACLDLTRELLAAHPERLAAQGKAR